MKYRKLGRRSTEIGLPVARMLALAGCKLAKGGATVAICVDDGPRAVKGSNKSRLSVTRQWCCIETLKVKFSVTYYL